MKKLIVLCLLLTPVIAHAAPWGGGVFGGVSSRNTLYYSASTASVVIASPTSARKQGADFVCTGVNDDAQWQAALTKLSLFPNGGKLSVLEGQYNFYQSVTIPSIAYGGYTIEGCGAENTTIWMQSGTNCDVFVTSITAGASTFVTMANFMINGNNTGNPGGGRAYYDGNGTGTCGDTLFQNVFFYNIQGAAIEFKSCWGARVLNCIFENSSSYGVKIDAGEDAGIEGCKFLYMLGNPIYCNAPACNIILNRVFMAGTNNIGINLGSGGSYCMVIGNECHHYSEISGCTFIKIASGNNAISNNMLECNGNTLTSTGILMTNNTTSSFGYGNVSYMTMSAQNQYPVINQGQGNTINCNGIIY